jgi:hypothetical protein
MNREQAVVELTASLNKAIDAWLEQSAPKQEDAWLSMGYVGGNLSRLMAKAAMAALESSADVQDYLKENEE